jgi:hypothetical protein
MTRLRFLLSGAYNFRSEWIIYPGKSKQRSFGRLLCKGCTYYSPDAAPRTVSFLSPLTPVVSTLIMQGREMKDTLQKE